MDVGSIGRILICGFFRLIGTCLIFGECPMKTLSKDEATSVSGGVAPLLVIGAVVLLSGCTKSCNPNRNCTPGQIAAKKC